MSIFFSKASIEIEIILFINGIYFERGKYRMFIARQAIFDRSMKVYAYELLYRDSKQATSYNHQLSPEKTTASVLSGLFEMGIDNISSNKKSFINFNYHSLFSDSLELIDSNDLVIEVLENTKVDNELVERLIELKKKGYKIALDDFVENIRDFPLVPLANIIKFDLMRTPLATIEEDVAYAVSLNKIIIAEKVETKEEFEEAKAMGFHLFQGYFFQKPNIIGGSSNKKSPKLSYMRIMTELNQEKPSFNEITEIIKADVNLTHRLLLATKKKKEHDENLVKNIKQSLVFMGFQQIRRWINILILRDLATDKPDELTHISLIRARFGELIAKNCSFRNRSNEIYGMLLFSSIDALVDLPIAEALAEISLSKDVEDALIHNKGPLSPFLQLIYSYEDADFKKVDELAKKLKVQAGQLNTYYVDAIIHSKMTVDHH